MSLQISVRDFRGVERADIELAPLALVAGRNEQGKSSLAQAVRAALAAEPIPIPGVLKKDAATLVREGAEKGYANACDGAGEVGIFWPKAEVRIEGGTAPSASHYAVGLKHLFDLDDKQRAQVLAQYIKSEPTQADLTAAMKDADYSGKAAEQVWAAVTGPDGWDGTYRKAREHSTKLRGQWESIAGEKYGAKKADTWKPEVLPGHCNREGLEKAIEDARAKVKAAVGSQAVSAVEIERLKTTAEVGLPDIEAMRKAKTKAEESLALARQELAQLPALPGAEPNTCNCPACGESLVLAMEDEHGFALAVHKPAGKKKPTKKEAEKRDALEERVAELQDEIDGHTRGIANAQRQIESAEVARKRLDEIGDQAAAPDEDAVALAESEEAKARDALAAFDAWVSAVRIHAEIAKNEKLVAILAPDGLRQRKLAAGLEFFNDGLKEASAAAGWPTVRLDESLNPHYGTRPVWAASGSGQWRARAVVQAVMAKLDGSAALVIDEADILDFRGRNGLIELLKHTDMPALVCLTINKPALVPDLAQAGLGTSYWIEGGIAEPVGQTQEQAA